ncbi:D-serine deaminase, pyridoxal phosphate-dependent [Thermanaeromonas toyohensis ToBE]|uniref:D-serine deaminase, pyridoxal phosphate-dependent n=1 Tax=Thermanaeromonas toyohensis ToBE TaxID=698762 RepID=A0A1W1V6V0_9FIRM|nr:alanine racemase [Thermanaeromonas toyohensis]SMB89072.1 D-serine deaminase, pyridoxal phosphate-dependent [Thermanaeromonas toyohensis ToBE]
MALNHTPARIGSNKWEIDTPAVVVDLTKLERNIQDMATFAAQVGVSLRPHVKAHKMLSIARRQLKAGACGLAVAKLSEAEVMLESGCQDILVANQVVTPEKIQKLLHLSEKVKLACAIDNADNAAFLSQVAHSRGKKIPVLIEVDTGLQRCGVLPGQPVIDLAKTVASLPGLELEGLMTHAGHAYAARNLEEVARIGQEEGEILSEAAERLRRWGLPCQVVSVGSTPTARYAGKVPGVTEIRPGNYVFYDAVQVALGVAEEEQCALTVIATVISRPARDRAVIDAGSKVLALDRGAHGTAAVQGFGLIKGRAGYVLERLSEEHGIISLPPNANLRLGEKLEIIPNHACPVVNLCDTVVVVRENKVVDLWSVEARGKSR